MLECKVCGTKFNAIVEKHYVARDNGKTGFKERKRNYISYTHDEEDENNDKS